MLRVTKRNPPLKGRMLWPYKRPTGAHGLEGNETHQKQGGNFLGLFIADLQRLRSHKQNLGSEKCGAVAPIFLDPRTMHVKSTLA